MSSTFIKHKVVPHIISKISPHQLIKIAGVNLFIPYYHIVSDDEVVHIKHLYPHKTLKQFTSDLDFLVKHFMLINLADLIAFIKRGKQLPPKALLLTFDDGFREIHDIVAPILLQKGIPAVFFINSSFTDNNNLCYQHKASILVEYLLQNNISKALQKQLVNFFSQHNIKAHDIKSGILAIKYHQRDLINDIERLLNVDVVVYLARHQPYLTSVQINKLIDDGFAIGAHSIDHPLYSDLSLEEQVKQTIDSVRFVRNKYNLCYGAFAFPHSDTGVSKQYFAQIEESGLVDISFGTAGMIGDSISYNFQRFSLEKPLMPANEIIALQIAKRFLRIAKQSNQIIRF